MSESHLPATFQFLGTGASLGVPVIGCDCAVCLSGDSRNRRLRTAALIKLGHKNILIDCGPDFRQQALRCGLGRIDGVILTHTHYDHIAALDELRIFSLRDEAPLPTLSSESTCNEVKERFPYLFSPSLYDAKLISRLDWQLLKGKEGVENFAGLTLHYVTYEQAGTEVNGYRFGNLAYLTDIRHYPPAIFASLQEIDILVISALRFTPSLFHFSIDEAIEFAEKTGAKEVWLTHIAHEVDYEKGTYYLPQNFHLAYDELELPFFAEVYHGSTG